MKSQPLLGSQDPGFQRSGISKLIQGSHITLMSEIKGQKFPNSGLLGSWEQGSESEPRVERELSSPSPPHPQVYDEQWVQTSAPGPEPRAADTGADDVGGQAGRKWAQRVGTRPCGPGLELQCCAGHPRTPKPSPRALPPTGRGHQAQQQGQPLPGRAHPAGLWLQH